MAKSQNGWPAIKNTTDPRLTSFGWITGKVLKGDVEVIFDYLCEQFNKRVEPITKAHSWGWYYRPVTNGRDLSNHSSATAIDLNAPAHPYGKANTFSRAEQAVINDIIRVELENVVRWGGNYTTSKKDDMHFEINAGAAAVKRVADKIRLWRKKPEPTPQPKPEPKPIPAPEPEEEEEEMKGFHYKNSAGNDIFCLFNEVSGFYSEHSGTEGAYNNSIAGKWKTGTWPEFTEKHAQVFKANLDKVRQGK